MRSRIALLSAALIMLTIALAPVASGSARPAPLLVPRDRIAGRYLVVLRAGAAGHGSSARAARDAAPALGRARAHGVRVERQFLHALNGYLATLSATQLAVVRADPAVAYVAQDGRAHSTDVETPTPSWGLDRIDQRAEPLDDTYGYTGTGAGVTAYLIDTGIRATHHEYAGRVTSGFSAVPGGNATTDCNGHGTHTAGTVGGAEFGVAKAVTLVPVQVLGCDGFGSWSWIIAGIDWVTAEHSGPSVANLSLGGFSYQPVDDAVTRSIASGVTYAISAGNDGVDACDRSPARTPLALTVAATSSDDARWAWPGGSGSDFGPCVDLFAPGDGIASAAALDDDASEQRTGTSMAAPHVTGVAALYLQAHPDATPAQVTAAILGAATPGVVTDAGAGSPNLLLYAAVDDTKNTTTTTTTTTRPPGSLRAEQKSYDADPADNAIRPGLELTDTGTEPIALPDVTVRYWFTRDAGSSRFLSYCDYLSLGCGHVSTKVVTLPAARPQADSYLEIGFDSGTVPAGGSTGEIQLRLHKSDWSVFDERDDYSHTTSGSFEPSPHVTVYLRGALIWGSEP